MQCVWFVRLNDLIPNISLTISHSESPTFTLFKGKKKNKTIFWVVIVYNRVTKKVKRPQFIVLRPRWYILKTSILWQAIFVIVNHGFLSTINMTEIKNENFFNFTGTYLIYYKNVPNICICTVLRVYLFSFPIYLWVVDKCIF